jgi:DNA-binding NtrC family response regulator
MSTVSAHSLQASLANCTILVIDDSEAVRTAFEVLLSLHGARVLAAATPDEGLAALAHEGVHLIIQDMNFRREATSGEEGIALFHEIRARFPHVPIVLLTAWTHLETAVELVRAGAADYIAKPWDDARLLTSVRNLIDLGRARRGRRVAPRPARGTRGARRALRPA